MKLLDIILEIEYRTYEAMMQVTFSEDGPDGYDDAIRALPGVTTCTVASKDKDSKKATYKIKIASTVKMISSFLIRLKAAAIFFEAGSYFSRDKNLNTLISRRSAGRPR